MPTSRDTDLPRRGAGALFATLACLAALLALTARCYAPPAPLAADAPAAVFSGGRAQAELAAILGEGRPHPMGSAANAAVRARLVERLSALGYDVRTHTGLACHAPTAVCGMPVNVLARLPGSDGDADGAVLLAAHYDSVPAGPGAADDGAGVAAILEIARALKHGPALRRDAILLLDDGEEAGLLGARLFVDRHPWAAEVKAAVNLEARGTSGPSFMFETGSANRWLMQLYGATIPAPVTNSLYYAVYKQLPNDTDFTVFKAAGYQGYNFAFLGDVARYHTPGDDLAHLDRRSLQHQGDNALRTLRALADAPPTDAAAGDAVYFDFFRLGLVQWPATAALPLALLLVALLGTVGLALLRRQRMSWRQLGWGVAGSLAALVGGSVAAAGLFLALRGAGVVPPVPGAPWIAHPGPATAAFAALAFAASGGLGALLGVRPGLWGAALGHALLVAVLGVAVAIALPGASFLLLVPGAATALGLLAAWARLPAVAAGPPPLPSATAVGALPAVASFAVLLPLVYFLYDALGAPAWPITTGALLLGTQALAPLLVAAGERARRGLFVAALSVVLAGLGATALLPRYSAEVPQRVNLEYRRDADQSRADWVLKPDGRLPPRLAAAAPFVAREERSGSGRPVYVAEAPDWAPDPTLLAPELQVLAASLAPEGIRYRLRLRSPRGAPEIQLRFPAAGTLRSLQSAGADGSSAPQPLPLRGEADGGRSVTFKGLSAAGVEFDFVIPGDAPRVVQVVDRHGFPAQGRFLQDARGTIGVPSRDGDASTVSRRVVLPAGR